MGQWADITSAIRSNGRFDRSAIMGVALERARREHDAFAAMGLPQAWNVLFAHELRLAWQVAKTAMDGVIAARLAAQMTAAERAARALELRAEIALTAIPPREADAADLRSQAAAVRAAGAAPSADVVTRANSGEINSGIGEAARVDKRTDRSSSHVPPLRRQDDLRLRIPGR